MKTIPRRRRAEAKTDYKLRLSLLKSNKPRLVIRKTNKYLIAQIIESDIAQDKVICGITSKALLSKDGDNAGKLKNRESAYQTGLLLGNKALEKGVKTAILDMGMHRNVQKSRIFALLNGAVDAGLNIPHSKEAFPELEKKAPTSTKTTKKAK